jgi:hypothetical protein
VPCIGLQAKAGSLFQKQEEKIMWRIEPWLAAGVFVSTAVTDAVYVMFNAAVSSRRRVPAATWSSIWYLLSAFAVITYTRNWLYVCFAAAGSWVGAYLSMTLLRKPPADSEPLNLKSVP